MKQHIGRDSLKYRLFYSH